MQLGCESLLGMCFPAKWKFPFRREFFNLQGAFLEPESGGGVGGL